MTISTHVLDTAAGRPAAGIRVELQRADDAAPRTVTAAETDGDGRVASLLPPGVTAGPGSYRLTFDVGGYFTSRGLDTFYSIVAIDFVVRDTSLHYHVPLLVSPYGYSTYRGS